MASPAVLCNSKHKPLFSSPGIDHRPLRHAYDASRGRRVDLGPLHRVVGCTQRRSVIRLLRVHSRGPYIRGHAFWVVSFGVGALYAPAKEKHKYVYGMQMGIFCQSRLFKERKVDPRKGEGSVEILYASPSFMDHILITNIWHIAARFGKPRRMDWADPPSWRVFDCRHSTVYILLLSSTGRRLEEYHRHLTENSRFAHNMPYIVEQ